MRTRILSSLHLLIGLLVLVAAAPRSFAQEPDAPDLTPSALSSAAPSLGGFLNPDGTLRLDGRYSGSIDPSGWKLDLDASGEPRFEPLASPAADDSLSGAIEGDAGWDARFGPPGAGGIVYAVAVLGDEVYVGGRFNGIGRLRTDNIARWNRVTRRWSTVARGVSGEVRSMAVSGGALYVGGALTAASGVAANGIAKWDPSSAEWSALGKGVQSVMGAIARGGDIYAIAVQGAKVYVGGAFQLVDDGNVRNLAVWDGSRWSAVDRPRQPNGYIYALALKGDTLFAGGAFTRMGNVNLPYIAAWSTTARAWSGVGGGTDRAVRALAVIGNDLYAGGAFTKAGSLTASRLARWDGAKWSGVGGGVDGTVHTLAVDGTDLYVGGELTTVAGLTANCIAKWNGGSWSMMGVGMGLTMEGASQWTPDYYALLVGAAIEEGPTTTPYVWAIAAVRGEVYAGGHFTSAGSASARHIAYWGGKSWSPLGDSVAVVNYNGADAAIYAMATNGDDLYLAGDFTTVGGIRANRIVRWNRVARRWYPLGSGIDGDAALVRSLAVRGNVLYAGGVFEGAGGKAARGIAQWDGTEWSAVGGGVGGDNPYVFALTFLGDDLYAGGTFTSAGGVPAGGVARLDRSTNTWSSLDGGVSNETNSAYVTALLASGSDLYVGGGFSRAGSLRANNVALWSGGAWKLLGTGVLNGADGPVRALASGTSGTIYAGGEFTTAGGKGASYIARWNGAEWSALGPGVNGTVQSILARGADLVIGGEFTASGSTKLGHMARWNGSGWSAVGSTTAGANGFIRSLADVAGAIYAGGEFSTVDGIFARNVAMVEGSDWSSLGADPQNGIQGTVTAIAVHDTDVYAGGAFAIVGGMRSGSLARWNGERWHVVAPPLNGAVRAIAIDGTGGLYVGGEFTKAGDLSVNGLAYWDGTRWSALAEGIGGATPYVYALAIADGSLYVGGAFSTAGTLRTNRVARWDIGAKRWEPMGGGVSGSSHFTFVDAIAIVGTDVYVGGVFPSAGGVRSENIARWDGSAWRDVGGGVNNTVYTLAATRSGEILVGGDFRATSELGLKYMARWDGSAWSAFPGVFRGPVTMIAAGDEDIFVAGSFTYLSDVQTEGLARWDGSAWRNVGRGPSRDYTAGAIRAMAASGKDLYVGGDFTLAGGRSAFNFGHWSRTTSASAPNAIETPRAASTIAASFTPNPASSEATLSFTLPRRGHATVALFDIRGELVATLASATFEAGPHELRWKPGDLPDGVYYCRIDADGASGSAKVIVMGGAR